MSGEMEDRSVGPGSGRDFGARIGLGGSPSFSAAFCTAFMLIVGPPFTFASSSGSYSVRPTLITTLTPAFSASFCTSSSLSRAYASVSFSKTKCEIFHSLKSLGRTVCGASRMTCSFCFLLSLVSEDETSFWQSILKLRVSHRFHNGLKSLPWLTGIAIG